MSGFQKIIYLCRIVTCVLCVLSRVHVYIYVAAMKNHRGVVQEQLKRLDHVQ
jgi:hypothetical protein